MGPRNVKRVKHAHNTSTVKLNDNCNYIPECYHSEHFVRPALWSCLRLAQTLTQSSMWGQRTRFGQVWARPDQPDQATSCICFSMLYISESESSTWPDEAWFEPSRDHASTSQTTSNARSTAGSSTLGDINWVHWDIRRLTFFVDSLGWFVLRFFIS